MRDKTLPICPLCGATNFGLIEMPDRKGLVALINAENDRAHAGNRGYGGLSPEDVLELVEAWLGMETP